MSGIAHEYMVEYIRSLIPQENGILSELENYAQNHKVPIVQKEVANFLDFMVTLKKPKRILELGTAIGYSSILMCLALEGIEHITTIERDSEMINLAKTVHKKHQQRIMNYIT